MIEISEDFPWNSAAPLRKVISGDGLLALFANQDDFISNSRLRDMGNVGEHLVHGDASEDRTMFAADQNLGAIGAGAQIAVPVTCGQRGDTQAARGNERSSIAERSAFWNFLHQADAAFPAQGGAQMAFERGDDPARSRRRHAIDQ